MPSRIYVDQIGHTNETVALEVESTGNMILQKDLKFSSLAAIRDSSGNSLIEESNGSVTLGNIRLNASGGISDSSGNAILLESGGVVSLSNSTLESTCDVRDANGGIPSGAKMLFQQTSAPVFWTKDTLHNNKALRVVSGTAGSGGSNSFTGTFASITSGSFALNSTTHLASHRHSFSVTGGAAQNTWNTPQGRLDQGSGTYYTSYTGGNGSHSHSIDLNVQYVDLIIATKD